MRFGALFKRAVLLMASSFKRCASCTMSAYVATVLVSVKGCIDSGPESAPSLLPHRYALGGTLASRIPLRAIGSPMPVPTAFHVHVATWYSANVLQWVVSARPSSGHNGGPEKVFGG